MMNLTTLAKRIPPSIRKQRILTDADPIHNAHPQQHDPNMLLLAEVWYTWVEPHKDKGYCPICLNNILNNYLAIYDELIDLEKEANTLDQI